MLLLENWSLCKFNILCTEIIFFHLYCSSRVITYELSYNFHFIPPTTLSFAPFSRALSAILAVRVECVTKERRTWKNVKYDNHVKVKLICFVLLCSCCVFPFFTPLLAFLYSCGICRVCVCVCGEGKKAQSYWYTLIVVECITKNRFKSFLPWHLTLACSLSLFPPFTVCYCCCCVMFSFRLLTMWIFSEVSFSFLFWLTWIWSCYATHMCVRRESDELWENFSR